MLGLDVFPNADVQVSSIFQSLCDYHLPFMLWKSEKPDSFSCFSTCDTHDENTVLAAMDSTLIQKQICLILPMTDELTNPGP